MTYILQDLLSIAAFISAGMHANANALDAASDNAGTGCLELVNAAVAYTGYAQALYTAAEAITNGTPGVFEYEVCEPFGAWYVTTTNALATDEDAGSIPDHAAVCSELRQLTFHFFVLADGSNGTALDMQAALTAVPLPPAVTL